MAAGRPRRANAGSQIGKLIQQEIDQDDFYSTAYGGFDEASEDNEYETEDDDDDIVDSDFDLSEKDEPDIQDKEEDLQPKPKKRKWIKPYKTESRKTVVSERRITIVKKSPVTDSSQERRILRKSTIDLAKEKEKQRQDQEKQRLKLSVQSLVHPKKHDRLTQEQLLNEAKRTEVINLASLESYRLQTEKKNYKEKKHTIDGPVVRYHSVVMPNVPITDITTVDDDMRNNQKRYSRNFIVFTDDTYYKTFSYVCPTRPKRVYCSVTGLPAKYIDPLTKVPYSTAHAFRIIRNRYVKEKEDKCEARIVQLNNWLQEKKKLKKQTL